MDFTIQKYKELLTCLQEAGYAFQTFAEFYTDPKKKVIVLRHDVDKLPENSLEFAKIQFSMGITGSYYFRIVPQSYNEKIIKEISTLGHEIGYHYETMDTSNGNIDLAYVEFCCNLDRFRKFVPVKTICMHGSPLSKFDNRTIWDKYDYKALEILAEPYFDIDYNKVLYLTDTGRRFDGGNVSVRDKPILKCKNNWSAFHSSDNIIGATKEGTFPEVAMINLHPQRWNDNLLLWTKELIKQNLKNVIKRGIVVKKQLKIKNQL